jgi:hypothetical protein
MFIQHIRLSLALSFPFPGGGGGGWGGGTSGVRLLQGEFLAPHRQREAEAAAAAAMDRDRTYYWSPWWMTQEQDQRAIKMNSPKRATFISLMRFRESVKLFACERTRLHVKIRNVEFWKVAVCSRKPAWPRARRTVNRLSKNRRCCAWCLTLAREPRA